MKKVRINIEQFRSWWENMHTKKPFPLGFATSEDWFTVQKADQFRTVLYIRHGHQVTVPNNFVIEESDDQKTC